MPTILLALAVVAICLLGSLVLPVSSIPTFLVWGIIYTLLFGSGTMKVSLTVDEREKIVNRLHGKATK